MSDDPLSPTALSDTIAVLTAELATQAGPFALVEELRAEIAALKLKNVQMRLALAQEVLEKHQSNCLITVGEEHFFASAQGPVVPVTSAAVFALKETWPHIAVATFLSDEIDF